MSDSSSSSVPDITFTDHFDNKANINLLMRFERQSEQLSHLTENTQDTINVVRELSQQISRLVTSIEVLRTRHENVENRLTTIEQSQMTDLHYQHKSSQNLVNNLVSWFFQVGSVVISLITMLYVLYFHK